jgi:hypothetical protein
MSVYFEKSIFATKRQYLFDETIYETVVDTLSLRDQDALCPLVKVVTLLTAVIEGYLPSFDEQMA